MVKLPLISKNKVVLLAVSLGIIIGAGMVIFLYLVNNAGNQVDVSYQNDPKQINLRFKDPESVINAEAPLEYEIIWQANNVKECKLVTDVIPQNPLEVSDFVVKPVVIGTQFVNTQGNLSLNIASVSGTAKVIHTVTCENLKLKGNPTVTSSVELTINNYDQKRRACLADLTKDGTLDVKDFGAFALKFRKKLPNCKQDIVGADCMYDKSDLIIFEKLYEIQGACK
jgi:hypothetical protein